MIDFDPLALLDDSVSEVMLSEDSGITDSINLRRDPEDTNDRFVRLVGNLQFYIREDRLRVTYLSCLRFPFFRTINMAELIEEDEIADVPRFLPTRIRPPKMSNKWLLAVFYQNTIATVIHRVKKTQIDLKPSNVVLDDDGNTVIVDVSGIGGRMYKWYAPEIRDKTSTLDLPFQTC